MQVIECGKDESFCNTPTHLLAFCVGLVCFCWFCFFMLVLLVSVGSGSVSVGSGSAFVGFVSFCWFEKRSQTCMIA